MRIFSRLLMVLGVAGCLAATTAVPALAQQGGAQGGVQGGVQSGGQLECPGPAFGLQGNPAQCPGVTPPSGSALECGSFAFPGLSTTPLQVFGDCVFIDNVDGDCGAIPFIPLGSAGDWNAFKQQAGVGALEKVKINHLCRGSSFTTPVCGQTQTAPDTRGGDAATFTVGDRTEVWTCTAGPGCTASWAITSTTGSCPEEVVGECNPAVNGQKLAAAPASSQLCSVGTPNPAALTGDGPWSWVCEAADGNSPTCRAEKEPGCNFDLCTVVDTCNVSWRVQYFSVEAQPGGFTLHCDKDGVDDDSPGSVGGRSPQHVARDVSCPGFVDFSQTRFAASDPTYQEQDRRDFYARYCGAQPAQDGACNANSTATVLPAAPSLAQACSVGASFASGPTANDDGSYSWTCAGVNGGNPSGTCQSQPTPAECGCGQFMNSFGFCVVEERPDPTIYSPPSHCSWSNYGNGDSGLVCQCPAPQPQCAYNPSTLSCDDEQSGPGTSNTEAIPCTPENEGYSYASGGGQRCSGTGGSSWVGTVYDCVCQ